MKNKIIVLVVFVITVFLSSCFSSISNDPLNLSEYALKCYQNNDLEPLIKYADSEYAEEIKRLESNEKELMKKLKAEADKDESKKKVLKLRSDLINNIKNAKFEKIGESEIKGGFTRIEYRAKTDNGNYSLNVHVKEVDGKWKLIAVRPM